MPVSDTEFVSIVLSHDSGMLARAACVCACVRARARVCVCVCVIWIFQVITQIIIIYCLKQESFLFGHGHMTAGPTGLFTSAHRCAVCGPTDYNWNDGLSASVAGPAATIRIVLINKPEQRRKQPGPIRHCMVVIRPCYRKNQK